MFQRVSAVGLLLCVAVACENTAEGVKQDTRALAAKAEQGAEDAKLTLERDIETFRAEAKRKLDQLSTSAAQAGDKAHGELSESGRQIKEQLAEAQKSIDEAGGKTRAEFDETKRKLNERLAELGEDQPGPGQGRRRCRKGAGVRSGREASFELRG